VREFSDTSNSGNRGTMYFACDPYSSSGSTTVHHSVNSSTNFASEAEGGSGLGTNCHYNLSLRFCTLTRNARRCCLFLTWSIQNSDISCVAMLNNSCESDSSYMGFIFVRSTLTLFNCVFQSNTFDYILGGDHSITFANCEFDFQLLNKTGDISFSTTNCTYEIQQTSLTDCRTRTPMRSGTQTKSKSPSLTSTMSRSPSPTATRCQTPTRSPVSISETGHEEIPL
jgi:hypothetical protein